MRGDEWVEVVYNKDLVFCFGPNQTFGFGLRPGPIKTDAPLGGYNAVKLKNILFYLNF